MAMEDPKLMASLYVGDLHPAVMENDLAAMFGRVGPLVSVHICRENLSLKSLCYGYVNFWFRCHASTALKCLNHARLKGKTIRVMWSDRNPATRKNTIGNLYVKNLDPSITGARLQEVFSKYGTVLSCKVAEARGVSKGFGFVQFNSDDSAVAAIDALHDTMLEGKQLYVSKFVRQTGRKDAEVCLKNLYVKNIDDEVTEDVLEDKFSEHGKVACVVIMKDEQGKSRGFGFVNFESHEEAKQAMESLNGEQLGSKNLFVSWAVRRAEMKQRFGLVNGFRSRESSTSNLFVKNLNPSVDDRKLRELFNHYGRLVSAKVIQDGDGISKNFGFVHFASSDEANLALNSLSGTDFEGRTLHVALARRQGEGTFRLQKSCAYFPYQQPQYMPYRRPPNWSFPYFDPPMLPMELNQWYPNFYRNFTGPFGPRNHPFPGQGFPGIFNPPAMQLAALNKYKQHNFSEIQIKHSSLLENKILGDLEYKGHPAVQGPCKTGQSFMPHPLVQNLQPGIETSGNEMKRDVKKYDIWSLLDHSVNNMKGPCRLSARRVM